MSFKSLLLIAEGEQTRNGVDEHAIFSNGRLDFTTMYGQDFPHVAVYPYRLTTQEPFTIFRYCVYRRKHGE